MALSRVKSWVEGDILTAAELNAEFNNLLNNPIAFVSPWLGPMDANGQALQNLAAGTVTSPGLTATGDSNTGLFFSAADTLDFAAGGVRVLQLSTAAAAVNYLDVVPAATGAAPLVRAEGTDTDVSLNLVPKGAGLVQIAGDPAGGILFTAVFGD